MGRSTTFPSPSCEAVIHRVSPATTTVVPSGGVAAAFVSMPGGSEPVIHASHASGIRAEGSAPPEGAGCVAAGDRRVAGEEGCAASPGLVCANAHAPPMTRTATIAPNASRRRRTFARWVIAVRLAMDLRG